MSKLGEFLKSKTYVEINNDMYSFKTDDELFEEMANFIISLEPDQLNDKQLEKILDIMEELDVEPFFDEIEDEDVSEIRLAKKTKKIKKIKAKKYYRRNKSKIKKRRKMFKRSAKGRLRKKKSIRLAKVGKTATGRKKVRYRKS